MELDSSIPKSIKTSRAGYDVTVYARGKRLETLKKDGLIYGLNGKKQKAHIAIIGKLKSDDKYDFIFLTVKENQVHQALEELSANNSPNIVTMVNTLEPYGEWEGICGKGKGRIIPAFPGAGGGFDHGVLKAALTLWIIQPTTFAEIDGSRTERTRVLSTIFKKSKIPYQIVKDMHQWQLCHLAMVVPLADAYYVAKSPQEVWKEAKVMDKTARHLMKCGSCMRNFINMSKGIITTTLRKEGAEGLPKFLQKEE